MTAIEVSEEQLEIFKALKKRTNRIEKKKQIGCSQQISKLVDDIHKKYLKRHKQDKKEAKDEIH